MRGCPHFLSLKRLERGHWGRHPGVAERQLRTADASNCRRSAAGVVTAIPASFLSSHHLGKAGLNVADQRIIALLANDAGVLGPPERQVAHAISH